MKLDPLAAMVVAELPAGTVFGLTEVSDGAGLAVVWIVNVAPPDVPPPGAGVTTVTVAVPADAKSVAGTCAVSVVEFV